jgi:hypothetical protein
MKKVLFIVALCAATITNAQTLTSKNGTPLLPEAGEWAIGFDAVPVLQAVGNLMYNAGDSLNFSQMQHTLVAAYVKDANTQYRAMLRIGFGSTTTGAATGSFSGSDSILVPSEVKTSAMNITLGAGIQKNRGKGRVQGIYGAQLAIMFGNGGTTENTYLNPLTTDTTAQGNMQVTETKGGSNFGIGLNGFLGVEYFIGAKMSVGAEYGWGLMLNSTGEGETTTVSFNQTTPSNLDTQTKTAKTGDASAFSLDVMDATSIILKFYF